MKAIQITGPKSNPHLTLTKTLPKPNPTGSSLLLKVHAAGITADEITWPEVYDTPAQVPGHDVSGVVEAVGPSYKGPLSPGDEAFAFLRTSSHHGGQAEYVLVEEQDDIAPKPTSISHAQAAALPIPVLTAWEAIHQHARMERGDRVLVTGASGAVGRMVVQLARRLFDAEVIGLASARNSSAIKELGANDVVDYNAPNWENGIKDVDAVIDTVGGETLAKTWKTVKADGAIVTVGDPAPAWASGKQEPEELKEHPGVRSVYFILSPGPGLLARVRDMLDEGAVEPIPVKVFEVEKGVEAWEYAAQRGRDGKAVIQFSSDD